MALTQAQVDAFVSDGFVHLAGAVPSARARRCRDEIWQAIGYDPDDASTWADTLVRLPLMATPPFQEAANSPDLHEAFDQLVGPGRWERRTGLGTFPLRFPGPGPAKEAGWHVEASFVGPDGRMRVDLGSRGRALLMLFLFSDVGDDDAPTRIRVGSHRAVARILAPAGEGGLSIRALAAADRFASTASCPEATATGPAGTVYLCHPFLVHAAQRHRGTQPRFMAQPPLYPARPYDVASGGSPVEVAIRDALDQPAG